MLRYIKPPTVVLMSMVVLTSCLTATKVDRQVAKQYAEKQESQRKKQNDFILITTTLVANDDRISSSETKTSKVLPLILYWSWDYKNTCTLNPKIPINIFTATMQSYGSRKLNAKLKDQKLELVVQKVPNQFAIDDKAHLIFFGYAYGWDNVSIKGERMDMVVSYKLLKDNLELKSGTISIENFDDKKNIGMFTSWKKATTESLDQYDQNIATLTKLVVDKLAAEL